MKTNHRVVVDSNVLVSLFIRVSSIPGQAFSRALRDGTLLYSDETFAEAERILSRSKFDQFLASDARQEFLNRIRRIGTRIEIAEAVRVCRDPKDDKFLEVAVNGQGDLLITGDHDLLVLSRFRGISILSPSELLASEP